MKSVQEIKQNSKESFETLGYILELSLGDLIEEIKFSNIDFEVSTSDGLLDANGELNIKIGISNPDMTTIAGKLRSVDSRLNEVFRTYCLTHDGKLTKNKDLGESMSIGHIVYSMNYNSAEENILLLIGFILFDL